MLKFLSLFASASITCFESNATDYAEDYLVLDDALIEHPSSTVVTRVFDQSMLSLEAFQRGIGVGDLLIVDGSLSVASGDLYLSADGSLKQFSKPDDYDGLQIEGCGVITRSIRLFAGPSLDIEFSSTYPSLKSTIHDLLIRSNRSSFISRVAGDSMEGEGIFDGSLIVIDRAHPFRDMSVIVANYNGLFVLKIADKSNRRLLSANVQHKPVHVLPHDTFSYEGTVLCAIRFHRPTKFASKVL
ncbi:hypothetical protein OCF84_21140 (plasmid) [Shewanella xiamenensis]|uniref:Peptidase S24/S26A/S26B/S26C domain-containing protein n=1 Tax=Shewanella xiamenensis TaxID=332186 RepID=A0ABT6UH66_9GAMM|nr:S24 family peptidase [Shewanella xiamenensis]MDI5832619.1 hypothetical protein [Shewanella xiamenensis]WHF57764.1 hypothetical protein OCF84_21140 [Shewanella xiamenensis]